MPELRADPDLRRLAEAALEYEPPWDLVTADLAPAAQRYVRALSPDRVLALLDRLAALERERDLAIAHDRQPYPTVAAYEAVCAARDKWQALAEALEARALAGTPKP